MCLRQTVRTPARMFRYVIQEAGTSLARRCPVLVIGTSKSQLKLHQRRNHDGEVHYLRRFMAPRQSPPPYVVVTLKRAVCKVVET